MLKTILLLLIFTNSYALDLTAAKSKLKLLLPKVTIDRVTNTNIPSIYQVISGTKVFYINSDANYIFLGNMLDLNSRENLTQNSIKAIEKESWRKLPLELATIRVIGRGTKKLAIFIDPTCPFCKLLENNVISKLDDVTIYYFFQPLKNHLNAIDNIKKILCSEMPLQTYLSYIKDDITPKNQTCNINLTQTQELVNYLAIDALPTIILQDGSKITGLVPLDELKQRL